MGFASDLHFYCKLAKLTLYVTHICILHVYLYCTPLTFTFLEILKILSEKNSDNFLIIREKL